MKLATTTLDFYQYTSSQQESMEYLHKAGFKYLDYSFSLDYGSFYGHNGQKFGIFAENPELHIESVNKKADELGVKFIQVHSSLGAPLTKNNDEFINDTIKCIYSCKELGIKNLVVHSGYLPDISKKQSFILNREFFLTLLQHAEKCDINILVENFNKMTHDNIYWIDNASDLLELIEYVNHPLFHAVWDTGHANLQDKPQHEELKILGSHLYALHIQDNSGDVDSHVAPFFGTTNFDSLIHGLIDIGYSGYFTFEAGKMLKDFNKRRKFDADTRLLKAPIDLKIKAENFLYEIGKTILTAYDCFEE